MGLGGVGWSDRTAKSVVLVWWGSWCRGGGGLEVEGGVVVSQKGVRGS